MKNFNHVCTAGILLLIFGATAGCDVISLGSDSEDGFGTQAGPILYIGKDNKPFTEFHRKQLYSASEDGTQVKKLTNYENSEVIDASWSPDGGHIAMVKNHLSSVSRLPQNLYVVDPNGQNEQKMLTDENDTLGIRSISTPVWSPDSRRIAFLGVFDANNQGYGGRMDVFIVNIETLELKKITDSPNVKELLGNWSTSGNIHATEVYPGTNPTKNQMIVLNENGEFIKSWQHFTRNYSDPLLSHNEEHLVFMRGLYEDSNDGQNGSETESRVMIMSPDSDPDSAEVVTSGSFKSYQPKAWSPDDQEVLVMGMTTNEDRQQIEAPNRYHILKVSLDGSNVQEITPDDEDFYYEPVSWIDPADIGSDQ